MLSETDSDTNLQSITVEIQHARFLRDSKKSKTNWLCNAKIEQGFNQYKFTNESGPTDYDLNENTSYLQHKLEISINNTSIEALESLANYPVLITLNEVVISHSGKEKKGAPAKTVDEKIVPLGQVSIDIFPLLQDQTSITGTYKVIPFPSSPLTEGVPGENPDAEINVVISTEQQILSDNLRSMLNFLTITVESAFSIPRNMSTSPPANAHYIATMPSIKTSSKKPTQQPIVYSPGKTFNYADDRPSKIIWPDCECLTDAVFTSDVVPENKYEEEDGEFRDKTFQDFRYHVELNEPCVSWNIRRRLLLTMADEKRFKSSLTSTRVWPLEMFRSVVHDKHLVVHKPAATPEKPTKGKGAQQNAEKDQVKPEWTATDLEELINHHGIAYVNMTPLLYPGERHIRGAYAVQAFNEQDFEDKTKHKSQALEAIRKVFGTAPTLEQIKNLLQTRPQSPVSTKNKDNKKKSGDDGANNQNAPDSGSPEAGTPSDKTSLQQIKSEDVRSEGSVNLEAENDGSFGDMKTYIMVEMTLDRPLIAKRAIDELVEQVAAYLPMRGPYPPVEADSKQTAVDYRDTLHNILDQLIVDYVAVLREDKKSEFDYPSAEEEDFKIPKAKKEKPMSLSLKLQQQAELKKLKEPEALGLPKYIDKDNERYLFYLHNTGKFKLIMEALKHPILKLMRTRFPKTINHLDIREREDFSMKLYKFLTDECKQVLETAFTKMEETPKPSDSLLNLNPHSLRLLALEAEIEEDFEESEKHYQHRIAMDDREPQYWFDYSTLLLRRKKLVEAEACLREALSFNRKHFPSLLALAYISMHQANYPMAETLLEACTTFYPKSIIAWTFMGLYYERLGDQIGIERAFYNAKKVVIESNALLPEEKKENVFQANKNLQEGKLVEENATRVSGDRKSGETEGNNRVSSELPNETPLATSESGVPATPASSNTDALAAPQDENIPETRPTTETNDLKPEKTKKTKIDKAQQQALEANKRRPKRLDRRSTTSNKRDVSIFHMTFEFLMTVHAYPLAEQCLGHMMLDEDECKSYHFFTAAAQLHLARKEYKKAEERLQQAMKVTVEEPDALLLSGHVQYWKQQFDEAAKFYEWAMQIEYSAQIPEMQACFMRYADICMRNKEHKKAKGAYILLSRYYPTSRSWLGVGISCFYLEEFANAEDALTEANVLDHFDWRPWAYLCLICIRMKKFWESEECFINAIKCGIPDNEPMLNQLREELDQAGLALPVVAEEEFRSPDEVFIKRKFKLDEEYDEVKGCE